MSCPTITTIQKTECIGNSLVTINSNFQVLRDAVCDIRTGISISKDNVQIGTDIKGLNFIGNGVEVAASTNEVANIIINKEFPIGASGLEEQGINSGGGRNNYFILRDGSLRVTGLNEWGELGVGVADAVYTPRVAGFSPPLESDEGISKVYTQRSAAYVITTKGRLYGAGYNLDGQLGQGDNFLNYPFFRFINVLGETETPIAFQTNPLPGYAAAVTDPVVQLATGSGGVTSFITVFARTQSGALYAWGDNSRGQTGIPKVSSGSTEIIVTPTRIFSTGGTITDIQSGGNNKRTTAFVRDNRGKIFVIGRNGDGQAGVNTRVKDITTFQAVAGLPSDYVANKIRVGGTQDNISAWITLTDGTLWGAGYDNNGQASGNINKSKTLWYRSTIQPFFDPVDGFDGNDFVEDVVAHADNEATTCWALIRDGDGYRLKGWGDNSYGQLGIGTFNNAVQAIGAPIAGYGNWPWIQTGAKVKQVVVAGNGRKKTTLVLDTNNNLWAAGFGQTGLLGRGQLVDSALFVRVIYDKKMGVPVQIRSTNNDSGYGNFLVLLSSGKVLGWGYDSDVSIVAAWGWYKWRYRWYIYPYYTYDTTGSGQLGVDASPQITSIPSLVQIVV